MLELTNSIPLATEQTHLASRVTSQELSRRLTALAFVTVFATAALDKIGPVPDWFTKQFESTILGEIPDLIPLSFISIAIAEGLLAFVFLVLVVAPSRRLKLLPWALNGAALLFTALCFGQRVAHEFKDAGILFLSAAVCLLLAMQFAKDKA